MRSISPSLALAKLEEPVHLVDKDINGVVLHVRPRHSSPCKYHAQVSVSWENGLVVDLLEELCQRGDRVGRQCQLFLFVVARLLALGQCRATEG
jgi:hypothetical protein